MHLRHLTQTLLLASTLIPTASTHCKGTCPPALRLFIAKLIPAAYNQPTPEESATAFDLVPFAPNAKVEIVTPSEPPVTVATNATAARAFADQTRQVFQHVYATYTDFPNNGTTIIHANVTLAPSNGTLPATFQANVELDFDLHTCEIAVLRAVGNIPAALLGRRK